MKTNHFETTLRIMMTNLFRLTILLALTMPAIAASADDGADPGSALLNASRTLLGTPQAHAVRRKDPPAEPHREDGLVRVKDIADIQGVRGNQLVGYGLVVGLEGTGDGQSNLFTAQTIVNLLIKFNVNVPISAISVKNVAAVMVTADLPAFVKSGAKIDVNVASMGDAKSLQGGLLLQTPLRAANGDIYAVAQGNVSIGGFNFGAGGSSVQKNHVTAGRIPHGAYVEQDVPTTMLTGSNTIELALRDPDFTTASRIATAIRSELRGVSARASDAASVQIAVPSEYTGDLISFISRVETVSVTPDVTARIVVNERTGTVVMGGNVRLAAGSVAHGAISIRIENTPVVVPAPAFSPGSKPLIDRQKSTTVEEKPAQLGTIPNTTTVDQLVRALNKLGVTPRDLISILQGMHAAGMIAAEIEVQ
jgi:flagellar P-ring protein precursor FlgI